MSYMALQDKRLPEEACILEDVERPRIERDRITELSMFMATELLHARAFDIKIERRLAHDIEPFCWTILYVIYARAAQDARLRTPERAMLAQQLQQERADLFFTAWAPMTLLEKRTARIDGKGSPNRTSYFRGISALLAYYKPREDVAAVLQVLWTVILKLQPQTAIVDEGENRLWEKMIHPRARSALRVWPISVKTWLRRRAKTENAFKHDILTRAMQFLEEISVKEETKDVVGLSGGAAHVDERVD